MAKLETIVLAAPGFWGTNTQDSPLDMDVRFAALAINCVIDKKGRIAARKGTVPVSTNGGDLLGSSDGIEFLKEFIAEDGTKTMFSAGNNLVFTGTTTLVDVTPGAATVTANNWQGVTLNDSFYLFQSGHDPLVYPAGGTMVRVEDAGGYSGTVPQGNTVLSAYGRLFVADTAADKSTITWSDLLDGLAWTGGSSGAINLRKHWPRGYDTVVAMAAYNDFLVVFGKTSILIFSGASSPSTMEIFDTIKGIGCVARDTVEDIGTDLLFLSASGARSLGRTVADKAADIGDASKNVNDDIKGVYAAETGAIKGHYNEDEGFYIVSFQSTAVSYVFDTRYPLEDGSLRTTTWAQLTPLSMERTDDGEFYIGLVGGIEAYSGYLDNDDVQYDMTWLTHPLTFGVPGNLKFLKNIDVTLDGGGGYMPVIRWAWDHGTDFSSETITLSASGVSEYGIAEYNIGQYAGSTSLSSDSTPAGGSGKVLATGITTTINGTPFSIQQLEVQATIGRVL